MDEQKIRQIIRDEFDRNYRGGTPSVPPHRHDGNDNLRISQSDITPGIKGNSFLQINGLDTVTFTTTANPTQVLFYGIATHTVNGATTEMAIVNGNAQLGKSYLFNISTDTSVVPGQSQNLIQGSNFMYININNLLLTNAGICDNAIACVTGGGTTKVVASVTSFDKNSVTIKTTTMATNWSLEGNFIII